MGPFAYRSWVEISLKQIAANFRAVRDVVGPDVEVMPVVKADAYRHGAVEVSHALVRAGARWLAVSNVEEGAILRDRGITARILVMADFLPPERAGLLDYNLTPVIHSLADIAEWDRLAASRGITGRVSPEDRQRHGTVGHARSGVRDSGCDRKRQARPARRSDDALRLGSELRQHTDGGTASRLSDGLRGAGARRAYIRRSCICPAARPSLTAAATPGIAWCGPGHAVYGYVSPVAKGTAPPPLLDVRPALTWKTAVLAVKDLPAGALVGYGGMFRTAQPTRIAVLAAGYADGIPHRLSNKGRVIANGHLAPIIGAVSMDLTTIDVTHCPPLAVGDPVTLLGSEGGVSIDAQQIARIAGTISYSVLCGIHARVKRIYIDREP